MRVKGGFTTQRRHKKVLKMTKGQWGTRSKLFRRANDEGQRRAELVGGTHTGTAAFVGVSSAVCGLRA